MADIESDLRAAMHAAADSKAAVPDVLIGQVMRRHRQHVAMVAVTSVLAALVITISAVVAARAALQPSGQPPTHHLKMHHVKRSARRLPATLSGLPMPAGTTFRLLTNTSAGAGWYSTQTKRIEPIAGIPPLAQGAGYQFERLPGGFSFYRLVVNNPGCTTSYPCTGPPFRYYFVADGSRTATLIGAGVADQGVRAASRSDAVWLVTYPRPTDNLMTASARAQLVSTAGRPLGPRYQLPAGYSLDRAVGSYLLLFKFGQRKGPYVNLLWDPRTGRAVDRIDDVVAAGPEQIAWAVGCPSCKLHILNVASGTSVTTAVPGGHADELNGTMTDDGAWLAVQLAGEGSLAVIATSTGALTVIPGTDLRFSEWMNFGWLGASDRLLVTTGPGSEPTGPSQIAYWQPGDYRLRVATVRSPGETAVLEGARNQYSIVMGDNG